MTTYLEAIVRERDAHRVTDMLTQRFLLEAGLNWPGHNSPIAPPRGVIVRVVQPQPHNWNAQVLVFWDGEGIVPDLLEWTTPMWLEAAYDGKEPST